MVSYYIVSGKIIRADSLANCLSIARGLVSKNQSRICTVYRARKGEKTAALVMEVTCDGVREIRSRFVVKVKNIKSAGINGVYKK